MYVYNGETWEVPQTVKLIPDIGSIVITANGQIISQLSSAIVTRDQIQWLTDESPEKDHQEISGAKFENKDAWANGRRDSVQGVFFGYLALGSEIETPVAIKPFLTAVTIGAHETALLMYLQDKGLPVYEILGVSWSKMQGYTMITKFEEDAISLDNTVWNKGIDEPLSEHLTNLDAIKQVGRTLGLLHGNGIIHGDAQVKNFAVNKDKVRIVDLAQSRVLDFTDTSNEAKLSLGMYDDLMLFMDSIQSKGFIRRASKEETDSFFESVIATSYKSGMFEASGETETTIDTKRLIAYIIDRVRRDLNN